MRCMMWPLLCPTDHKKLPFMAMLRNLRNLIKAGISDKHHTAVIRRLTDQVGTDLFALVTGLGCDTTAPSSAGSQTRWV